MAERIFAFIDGNNLYSSFQSLDWKLDYFRFRVYLEEKYKVTRPIIFLAYSSSNEGLYSGLRSDGFTLVFRPATEAYQSKVRGSIDTEIVLQTFAEWNNYERAVVVSGDGDLYCLVDYLNQKGRLLRLLVPNYFHYSTHLNRYAGSKVDFMNNLRAKLEFLPV